ncbi:MAG: potassium-transporting ATPase [Mycobacterium sp.]|nr:potassium-transporting ATPase [Mycobacterium sp.]
MLIAVTSVVVYLALTVAVFTALGLIQKWVENL